MVGLDLAVATVDFFSLFSKDKRTQSQKDQAAEEREKREYEERQRRNNETNWNINHENQIFSLDQKIDFFKKNALRNAKEKKCFRGIVTVDFAATYVPLQQRVDLRTEAPTTTTTTTTYHHSGDFLPPSGLRGHLDAHTASAFVLALLFIF